MGSLKRKIGRKQSLKKSKKAKKNLKKALNATLGIPTNCTVCNDSFDPSTDASSWMVTVYDETVHLNCPSCYQKAES